MGALTHGELLRKLEEIYSSPAIPGSINVLWDLRSADLSGLDFSDIVTVKEFTASKWGTELNRRAALIISRDLHYGLARMFQALFRLDGFNGIRLFYDYEEGLAWART